MLINITCIYLLGSCGCAANIYIYISYRYICANIHHIYIFAKLMWMCCLYIYNIYIYIYIC